MFVIGSRSSCGCGRGWSCRHRTSRGGLVQVVVAVPVLVRVLAVHLGDKVADEGLLVEGGEVGAQEVVTHAMQTLMVELEEK